ncbi:MAG: acetyl-CoA carboxylase biotin carboxylase subunit [bacterium]|nr:acetyl-CoA carboxylase biotin carboxylase subunit [bacterium]
MFRSVLIANRGEIAARVVRACRALGVRSVVACSEVDREAPWVEEADDSVCIGPARADASYLDAGAVLQAAEQSECQAIHPGYGFLSENASFAARCEQQGITFIGPPASVIRLMGDKSRAKETLAGVGLETIPGSDGALDGPDSARRVAAEIGYPVLLKASSGGGGKGMRVCADEAELLRGYREAALEAEKAFGDPSLYLEKLIQGGRHIEFQILCDAQGNALHLGERECSVQRKHQKLIEESPSPVVDATLRSELGNRVARAVGELGYRNAGTVEFLRDRDARMYFMEMNTRLQVEHPVTEMVTGVDLVAQQLRIAANRPLDLGAVELEGHAIEMRINAEDPDAGFRPDPGEIVSFAPPVVKRSGVRVRWDSAIRAGYRIPPHYDSMIGKLIVHAGDRDAAIDGALEALESIEIVGVRTTVDLHRRLLADPTFRGGDYDVDWLATSGLVGV